jgi:hypothetical protein
VTTDLIAFLNARLDEDEAAAKDASGSDWRPGGSVWMMRAHPSEVQMVRTDAGLAVIHDDGSPSDAEAIHIARHDPARVLREVAAKRRIVGELANEVNTIDADRDGWTGVHDRDLAADPLLGEVMLRTVAAIYSDHPDYRQEWAPEW